MNKNWLIIKIVISFYHDIERYERRRLRSSSHKRVNDSYSLSFKHLINSISEHSYERFSSFWKSEHCEHLLLLQCYFRFNDDSVIIMLQNWIKSEEEKHSRFQLLQFFQIALTSEELTLSITVMLALWCFNSSAKISTSQSRSRSTNLIRLAYFLRKFNDIEESYLFLL